MPAAADAEAAASFWFIDAASDESWLDFRDVVRHRGILVVSFFFGSRLDTKLGGEEGVGGVGGSGGWRDSESEMESEMESEVVVWFGLVCDGTQSSQPSCSLGLCT